MEKMPFHAYLTEVVTSAPRRDPAAGALAPDWRDELPVLTGETVSLRELELGDAPSLLRMLTTDEVARFISPPPTTVEDFARFISWAHRQRQHGEYICFGVVPHGSSVAIGLFQVHKMDAGFATAEWGFALGSAYWGTGVFTEAGRLTVDFAIATLGVRRLEARAAVANGRGNGALQKIGAVQEGILRRSFVRDGEPHDQVLWSILDTEWLQARARWSSKVQVH